MGNLSVQWKEATEMDRYVGINVTKGNIQDNPALLFKFPQRCTIESPETYIVELAYVYPEDILLTDAPIQTVTRARYLASRSSFLGRAT